ncbi:unnamed protein product [Closterium sp. NIES-53]
MRSIYVALGRLSPGVTSSFLIRSCPLLSPSSLSPHAPSCSFIPCPLLPPSFPSCSPSLPACLFWPGFKLWSDAGTWPGGVVPGVGAGKGASATIPCGVAVLLNVPSVVLSTLTIRGMLKIEDTVSRPVVAVNASFVIVEGQLIAGSSAKHFSQKAIFTLTHNPNGRAPYQYTANAPADPANPRNFGHKAFVVVPCVAWRTASYCALLCSAGAAPTLPSLPPPPLPIPVLIPIPTTLLSPGPQVGGQVHMHGMPGGSSTPSWCRLAATAQEGDRAILVDRDVTAWPVGFYVGLASTDFYADQIDVAKIVSVTAVGGNKWKVALSAPLSYSHFGEVVSDGFGGTIDERGEVVLLNRTVVIRGEDEAAPHNWEGGHFMVFFTQTAQMIEGVEFAQMGQQGQLGRYNIHFHLCGNQAGKSVVRKNVMHDSKQRCVVVHATFNLTVEENVAFNTRGHCFMVEEGGEQGNSFIRNVGIWTRPVKVKISSDETDDEPSTFWITNPNNNYIGNVAAGSEDTGFWLELRDEVRGLSLQWSKINTLIPFNYHRVGTFAGNVAHSCDTGFRDYPGGFMPRFNASTLDQDETYWDHPVWVTISGFTFYKNIYAGAFVHNTDYVVFDGFTAADNMWGVEMSQVEGIVMRNLRVVGQTTNYGNPWDCTDPDSDGCAPVSGCKFPLAKGQQGRSVGDGGWEEPVYGLVLTQSPGFTDGLFNNVVDGAKFAGFDNTCKTSAAVAVGGDMGTYWNAGNSLKNLKFSTATRTNPVFVQPRKYPSRYDSSETEDHGEAETQVALRDMDGSILGSVLGKTSAGKKNRLPSAAAAAGSGAAAVSVAAAVAADGDDGDDGSATPSAAIPASLGKLVLARKAYPLHHRRLLAASTSSAAVTTAAKPASRRRTLRVAASVAATVSALKRSGGRFSRRPSSYDPRPRSRKKHSRASFRKSASSARLPARSSSSSPSSSSSFFSTSSLSSSPRTSTSKKATPLPSGFLVANNKAVLPPLTPSGTYGSCKPMPGANAYACPSPAHCFRTVNVRYLEPATAGNVNRTQAHGVMSFIKVVRARDGAQQTFDGNSDNIELEEGEKKAERVFGFTALVGEVYVVEVVGPRGKEEWQPQEVDVYFGDGVDKDFAGSCLGAVTVRLKAPASGDTQWAARMADIAAWRPCAGTTLHAPTLFSYECDAKSGQQQVQVVLSGDVDYYLPATLYVTQDPPAPCSTPSRCGLLEPRAVWRYNQQGGELHARYPGGPAFYNPNFKDSSWPSGPAPLAYVDYEWDMVGTLLAEPSWNKRTTYYFRTSFSLTNSACFSHLLLQMPVNDGVIVYINNREVLRLNMPKGAVSTSTSALSDKEAINDDGDDDRFIYTDATVKLTGAAAAPVLTDGVNVVAAEVHLNQDDGWDIAWALRLSALPSYVPQQIPVC